MTCGIYKLVFKGTNKVYIGQSINIEKRFTGHIRDLISNSHSIKMNLAYKSFGLPEYTILLECKDIELNELENEAIKIYNAVDDGFNTCYKAEDMPNRHLNNDGSSLIQYTKDQVILAFNTFISNSELTAKEIAVSSGISEGMAFAMMSGNSYTWLQNLDPSNYSKYITNRCHGNSASSKGIVYPSIVSPEGITYSIINRSAFAREHALDCGALGRVLRSVSKSHKGWKLA